MKQLAEYTNARVALGQAGGSLPTRPLLALRLAHAEARDAVAATVDLPALFAERGWPFAVASSAVKDHEEYLRRPDLGRQLGAMRDLPPQRLVFAVAAGLSSYAIESHAVKLLDEVFQLLGQTYPLLLLNYARVGLSDPIGERLQADLVVLLIGERPGLSSPDSLGIYLTWQPRPGRTDADRNCISNVHANGLSYELAAHKLVFLIRESQRRRLSGIALKETASLIIEK